jgi:hypothetical protein
MNFVYICRDGENQELRYSVRSVSYFYPDAEIHIFGGKPAWYSGKYTYVKDAGSKFDNINNCYKEICGSNFDEFILMNDDFFILEKPQSFEYYFDGTIESKIDSHVSQYGLSKYARVLSEANNKLKKMGITNPLNYDIHTPMMFNREKLSSIIDMSFAPRSMYGNIFNVGGEKINDVKIYKDTDSIDVNKYFLSSEDDSFVKVKKILDEKFSNKSVYES